MNRRDFLAVSATAAAGAACAPGFRFEETPRWPVPSRSQLRWQRAELWRVVVEKSARPPRLGETGLFSGDLARRNGVR